jgi:hypothetical protein
MKTDLIFKTLPAGRGGLGRVLFVESERKEIYLPHAGLLGKAKSISGQSIFKVCQ